MSRAFVVTANHLREGYVLYLTADRTWSRADADAQLHDTEADTEPSLAWARTQTAEVLGAYVIPVDLDDDRGLAQRSQRERLRAVGGADVLRRLGYSTER